MDAKQLAYFEDVWNIHSPLECEGEYCVFHNPSYHHMKDWPIVIRDTGLVERQCPCGVGHPDPDSLAYFKRMGHDYMGVHGCCGCCKRQLSGMPL